MPVGTETLLPNRGLGTEAEGIHEFEMGMEEEDGQGEDGRGGKGDNSILQPGVSTILRRGRVFLTPGSNNEDDEAVASASGLEVTAPVSERVRGVYAGLMMETIIEEICSS